MNDRRKSCVAPIAVVVLMLLPAAYMGTYFAMLDCNVVVGYLSQKGPS